MRIKFILIFAMMLGFPMLAQATVLHPVLRVSSLPGFGTMKCSPPIGFSSAYANQSYFITLSPQTTIHLSVSSSYMNCPGQSPRSSDSIIFLSANYMNSMYTILIHNPLAILRNPKTPGFNITRLFYGAETIRDTAGKQPLTGLLRAAASVEVKSPQCTLAGGWCPITVYLSFNRVTATLTINKVTGAGFGTAPSSPNSQGAISRNSRTIKVDWFGFWGGPSKANTPTGFNIYRRCTRGNWLNGKYIKKYTVKANPKTLGGTQTFVDRRVRPGMWCDYKVSAFNAAGESALFGGVSATVLQRPILSKGMSIPGGKGIRSRNIAFLRPRYSHVQGYQVFIKKRVKKRVKTFNKTTGKWTWKWAWKTKWRYVQTFRGVGVKGVKGTIWRPIPKRKGFIELGRNLPKGAVRIYRIRFFARNSSSILSKPIRIRAR